MSGGATDCPSCALPVPHPGQLVNCLDARRREWHWECAEKMLGRLPAAPEQPGEPLRLDGIPVRLRGCPGCGRPPESVNPEDHFVDRANRFWHWGSAQERLGG